MVVAMTVIARIMLVMQMNMIVIAMVMVIILVDNGQSSYNDNNKKRNINN